MTLINFYETEKIKKRLPKFKDEQVKLTGMKLRTRILICGSSGSGKTNALYNYLYLTSQGKGTFQHVFIAYKTDEPLYDEIKDQLKDKCTTFRDAMEIPQVETFPDNTDDNILFIFDDMVNEVDSKILKKFKNYFAFGRKKGLTLLFLTQSYFQTNKFLRDQMNYILLLSIKSEMDLHRIIKEYEIPKITKEQVVNMFDEATQTPLHFLKICTDKCPLNQKFSKNFLDYLNPDDYNN